MARVGTIVTAVNITGTVRESTLSFDNSISTICKETQICLISWLGSMYTETNVDFKIPIRLLVLVYIIVLHLFLLCNAFKWFFI